MANVFNDQARERFTRSLAFMNKAETLLKDDVIYRSALADAVSAIKNMLQGYLLLKIAVTPASAVTQRWQEIAASNRMPELIQATVEAGLDLRGLASDIKRLNNERNFRAHDDPNLHIEPGQAQRALDLALAVQRSIRKAVQGAPELADQRQGTVNRIASVARAAVSGQLARGAPPPAPSPRQETAPITSDDLETQAERVDQRDMDAAPPVAAEQASAEQVEVPETSTSMAPDSVGATALTDDTAEAQESEPAEPVAADGDADIDTDTDEMPVIGVRRHDRGSRHFIRRALVAALLVILGVLVGVGVTVPLVVGGVPGWLGAPLSFMRTQTNQPVATLTPPPAPTPTSVVATGMPLLSGNLAAGPVVCSGGVTTLTLRNLGATSQSWSAASPDASGATFTVSGSSRRGTRVVSGTLSAGGSAILDIHTVSNQYHIVVIGGEGAIMLTAGTC